MTRALVFAVILWIAVAWVACNSDPVNHGSTNNPNVAIDLLFEHDDCKVYRFFDGGEYIYFAKCANASASTSWRQSEGKTSRAVMVTTN